MLFRIENISIIIKYLVILIIFQEIVNRLFIYNKTLYFFLSYIIVENHV